MIRYVEEYNRTKFENQSSQDEDLSGNFVRVAPLTTVVALWDGRGKGGRCTIIMKSERDLYINSIKIDFSVFEAYFN